MKEILTASTLNTWAANDERRDVRTQSRRERTECVGCQLTIAALQARGRSNVCYDVLAQGDGSEVWNSFAKTGVYRIPMRRASSGEPLAVAIASEVTLEPGEKKTVPMGHSRGICGKEFGSDESGNRALHGFLRKRRRMRGRSRAMDS